MAAPSVPNMTARDFRPAGQLAQLLGVKCVTYGPPGKGKTPFLTTAPNACGMFCEPGLLSIRGAAQPMAIARYTRAEIEEFFRWLFGSNERKQYHTLFIDSISQWAEIETKYQLTQNRDGRMAYGEMARNIIDKLEKLFFLPEMHVLLIAKLGEANGPMGPVLRPYFPGKELHVRVPHMFDEVLMLDTFEIPGHGMTRALKCWGSNNDVCRDRSGMLNEYEPADFGVIVNKCMKAQQQQG